MFSDQAEPKDILIDLDHYLRGMDIRTFATFRNLTPFIIKQTGIIEHDSIVEILDAVRKTKRRECRGREEVEKEHERLLKLREMEASSWEDGINIYHDDEKWEITHNELHELICDNEALQELEVWVDIRFFFRLQKRALKMRVRFITMVKTGRWESVRDSSDSTSWCSGSSFDDDSGRW